MGKGFIKNSLTMQSVPFVSKDDPKCWAFSWDPPYLKVNPPFLSSFNMGGSRLQKYNTKLRQLLNHNI